MTLNTGAQILVAEDEPAILDGLTVLLELAGHTVIGACNGRHGLDQAQRLLPDLIVIDYMMPLLDGIAMLTAVRADPALHGTPVILISAATAIPHAEGVQVDAFLKKPFAIDDLLHTIESLLKH